MNKRCRKCDMEKPLDAFGNDKRRRDGKFPYCKSCRLIKNGPVEINRRRKETLLASGLQECSQCNEAKPLDNFYSDFSRVSGKHPWCSLCATKYKRAKGHLWHRKIQEIECLGELGFRKCRTCNAVDFLEMFVKDDRCPYGVTARCKRCQRRAAIKTKLWRLKRNRDYRKIDIFVRDGYICYLCNDKLDPNTPWPHPKTPTIEHIIPVSAGGADLTHNVKTACWDCNNKKSTNSLDTFLKKRDST